MIAAIIPIVIELVIKLISYFMKKKGADHKDWLALVDFAKVLRAKNLIRSGYILKLQTSQESYIDKRIDEIESKENVSKADK